MRRWGGIVSVPFLILQPLCGRIEVPSYSPPQDNAFDYYLRAVELLPAERAWDELFERLQTTDPSQVELLLVDAAPALEQLRLGLDKPCVMPLVEHFATELPYLADFRSLTRLLLVEAWFHWEKGDVTAAFGSCVDTLKLGQDIARNGMLIHKLVSIACESMALAQMRQLAPASSDAETLAGVIHKLEDFETTEVPLSETLAVEWGCVQRSLHAWRKDPAAQPNDSKAPPPPNPVGSALMLDEALAQLETYYALMIERAACDYWRRDQRDIGLEAANPLVKMVAPPLVRLLEDNTRHIADLRGTLLVMALESYLATHSRYPEELPELVPSILRKIPVDPFSGQSFVYRRTDELTYLLYSVGPDGLDDQGTTLDDTGRPADILFSPFLS